MSSCRQEARAVKAMAKFLNRNTLAVQCWWVKTPETCGGIHLITAAHPTSTSLPLPSQPRAGLGVSLSTPLPHIQDSTNPITFKSLLRTHLLKEAFHL